MNYDELKQIWAQKYDTVPQQLEKLKQIPAVATAFNTNIDAILKITGESLKKLITDNHITVDELTNIELSNFRKPTRCYYRHCQMFQQRDCRRMGYRRR